MTLFCLPFKTRRKLEQDLVVFSSTYLLCYFPCFSSLMPYNIQTSRFYTFQPSSICLPFIILYCFHERSKIHSYMQKIVTLYHLYINMFRLHNWQKRLTDYYISFVNCDVLIYLRWYDDSTTYIHCMWAIIISWSRDKISRCKILKPS